MNDNQLISVIVPCYNQAKYLDECLQSILDQTFTDWECIIVNDGSLDNTENVAEKWLKKDKRFKYKYKENGGLSSARNAGIDEANGEWIQFLDCDDKIASNKFEISAQYFNSFDLIISDFQMFNKYGFQRNYCSFTEEKINFDNLLNKWDIEYSIPIHCGIFKKKYLTKFNQNLKAKEDWIFWLNYLKSEPRVMVLTEKLAFYRSHISSMTRNIDFMYANELLAFEYIYDYLEGDNKKQFLLNRLDYKNSIIKKYNGNRLFNILKRLRNLFK